MPPKTAPSVGVNQRATGYWILFIAGATGFLISFCQSVVPIAAPRIAKSLGADLTDLQLVTNALFLPLVALVIFGGLAADRWGRRRIFLIGMLLLLVGAIGSTIAPSVDVLIGARLVEGIGAAFAMPTSVALLRACYSGPSLLRALSVWVGCAVGGAAVGPIIGGVLLHAGDWRIVFLPEVVIAAVGLIGGALVLRGEALEKGDRVDLHALWNIVLVVGLLTAMLGLVLLGREASPALAIGALAAGALILGGVAARSGWLLGGTAVAGWWRHLGAGIIVAVAGLFAVTGVFFLSAIYLQRDLGFSPLMAAVALLPQTGLAACLAFFGGRVIDRFGLRAVLMVAFAIEAAGSLWLLHLDANSTYIDLLPTQLALAVTVAVIPTASLAVVLRSGPPSRSGVLAGVQSAALNLGNLLAIAVLSVVIATTIADRFYEVLPAGIESVVPAVAGSRLAVGPSPAGEELAPAVRAAVATAQRAAFAHAFGTAGLVSGLISIGGLLISWRLLRPRSQSEQ